MIISKRLALAVLCLLTSVILVAQYSESVVNIVWGEELKESEKNTFDDLAGWDDEGFYIVKKEKRDFMLSYFDKSLNEQKSTVIDLKDFGKKRVYEQCIYFGDKLCLFSTELFKMKLMKYFYIQTLDKNNFVPNNDEFLITDFKYKFYYLLQEELFTFVASPDSSKLLVYYDTPRDKSSREQFGFHVFDTELNVLWHEYKELLVNDLKYDIDRHVINNNGDVFLLGKTEKRNKGSEFTIYAFYNRGEGYTEYKVDFPGLITTEGQLSLSQDGKLICCGFYTRNDVDKIAGYWFVSFDTNTHEIVNSYHTEFDIDLITQNLTYKEEEKTRKKDEKGKNVDLANYEIRELIPATDGGYFLLGEQLIVQEKELLPAKHGDNPAIKIFYYYNDIVVLRLNSEGSLVWSQKIAKSQKSLNDGGYYSSYGVTSQNDNLYFVFNDNEKNLNYDGSGKVYTFRANQDDVAVVVKLDTEGAQKRTALFAIDKRDIVLRAKKCKEINSGEMIIYGEKKTTQRFARLIFN